MRHDLSRLLANVALVRRANFSASAKIQIRHGSFRFKKTFQS